MRYRWSSTGNDALIRMKQALEDALVSDKRMSLKAIAQQLGCTTAVLYKRFPDLCKEIALRRRIELRKQHEERMTRISLEIHQTVMILHQQGMYPSSIQVGKQLNNSHILRPKKAREAWILALDELGYPTDHLKK